MQQDERRTQTPTAAGWRPEMTASALFLTVLAVLLYGVAVYFDDAHNGRAAGNEAMALSAALGVYGLLMAAVGRRTGNRYLQRGARLVQAGGLLYLVVGGIMANARWALPEMRFLGYVGALGSIWAVEALVPDEELGGLLLLTAAVSGFLTCGFEVVRWFEPAFTLSPGQLLTPELYAWQESTKAFWTVILWTGYAAAVKAGAVRAQSAEGRLLGDGMVAVALLYGAAAGTAAPLTLRAGAAAGLLASLALSAYWRTRYPLHQYRREGPLLALLGVAGLLAAAMMCR